MTQLLLQCGADTNARTSVTRRSPLISLAAAAEAAVVERTKKTAELLGQAHESGMTTGAGAVPPEPTEAEVMRARARVAELLLREGAAEAGMSDTAGRSALCYARAAGPLAAPLVEVLNQFSEESESVEMGPGGSSSSSGDGGQAACWRGTKCTFCGDFWNE
mmetsp:Transcript_53077/g.91151  ORF Transcript_53077/g.91151 Transcript_53077/m.91151 type:complete len:162 (-) Transcript_53077:20-505(-)